MQNMQDTTDHQQDARDTRAKRWGELGQRYDRMAMVSFLLGVRIFGRSLEDRQVNIAISFLTLGFLLLIGLSKLSPRMSVGRLVGENAGWAVDRVIGDAQQIAVDRQVDRVVGDIQQTGSEMVPARPKTPTPS